MKIVFIVGSLTDSHIVKRIEAFVEKGFNVDVYGYMRGVNYTNKIKQVEPQIIGILENEKYLKRIFSGFKDIRRIIKSYPQGTLYFLWGFDLSLVHWFCHTRYIYEISDIRYAQFPFGLDKLFIALDRRIIKKSQVTLLTSEGFINYIGLEDSLLKKCIFMPNKLSPSMIHTDRPQPAKKVGIIRVGYIGLYRYPNTVVKMARIIGDEFADRYEFHFSGISNDPKLMDDIKDLTQKYDNVFEHGPFRNPDDLQAVYATLDVVAANYDTAGINERIAEPNKLYESIFFNKPIIVSEGTYLAEKVKKMGIGYIVGKQEQDIRLFLKDLDADDVLEKSRKANTIVSMNLIEDYNELWNRINQI